uniref:Evasin n=1 Tax=Amblyomma maculatum TaxID=34609 RepID=G3MSV3_AMBMU
MRILGFLISTLPFLLASSEGNTVPDIPGCKDVEKTTKPAQSSPTTKRESPTSTAEVTTGPTTNPTTQAATRPDLGTYGLYYDEFNCNHKVLRTAERTLTVNCRAECLDGVYPLQSGQTCLQALSPDYHPKSSRRTRVCQVGRCIFGYCSLTKLTVGCFAPQVSYHRALAGSHWQPRRK